MEEKTLKNWQAEVDHYIGQFKEGYFPPFELLARMSEELGELSREVHHQYGMKKKKDTEDKSSMEEELADLLFVIICFANAEKLSLNAAMSTVMEKFRTRDEHRWTRKEE
ncbi:nucleotide pyrophosphohydrolase [Paenisporosarcina cavernae]|uniref:Nucleotide pyrophosphohydrolase n=1 Tax=Paenisporosarcina cavernae TaxID=2320858 RepID=A0A385YV85_9BACL|nr:nucleotide pyrophosphohydrolase [Paenisporosarcina cavernae]AYC29403.1 nucleotide pyrophosphohydrolase [Paenisporosarcina cavernae]